MNGDEHGPAALNMVKVRLVHYMEIVLQAALNMVKVRLEHNTKRHVEVDGDEHGPAALNMVKVRLVPYIT